MWIAAVNGAEESRELRPPVEGHPHDEESDEEVIGEQHGSLPLICILINIHHFASKIIHVLANKQGAGVAWSLENALTSKRRTTPPTAPRARGTHVVTSLAQARALVDPLRVRILQEFVDQPRTTKQVADRLHEKPTRLYRHVDALVRAGLLRAKGERPKRGTIERYFQAVASRFEIDPRLFGPPGPKGQSKRREMIHTLLEQTEADVVRALDRCGQDDPMGPLLLRAEVRAGEPELRRLRKTLIEWLQECETVSKGRPTSSQTHRFATVVAFFPTD